MDQIKMFFEKIQVDVELQEKLKAVQVKTLMEALESMEALAKENGFEITKEDLLKHIISAKGPIDHDGELNEDELDAIAGGGWGEWIVYSIGSMGLMCAASAIGKIFDTCGLDHPENIPSSRY